ncbi:MAG TPA: carboxypeptidase-like regulatory domain-containing protein, partial [Chitinophagaceae bacterium]
MRPILTILFTLAGLAGYSQVYITGNVRDNKGRILAGASITLQGSYDGGVTDSSGDYRFRTSEKGKHTLVASMIGNHSFTQEVMI